MANAAEAFRIKGELYEVVDDTARETASAATVLEEFDRQKSIGQYPGRSLADAFAAEIAAKGDIYAWLHSRVQDADFSGLRIGDYMDVPVAAGSNVPAQTVRYLLAAVDPHYQCSDSPMPAPPCVRARRAGSCERQQGHQHKLYHVEHHGHQQRKRHCQRTLPCQPPSRLGDQRLSASPSGGASQRAYQPPFVV